MRKHGFTLIELSIVLVIIGLIIGGGLVGKDLIDSAKQRSFISQLDRYTSAINTFKLKYNCLPGDCSNAVTFGLGQVSGPGQNGDGNGQIRSSLSEFGGSWWQSHEKVNLWFHMASAGLVESGFQGWTSTQPTTVEGMRNYFPTPAIGVGGANLPAIVPFSMDSKNGLALVAIYGNPAVPDGYSYTLTALEAYNLDQKLDDGLPQTGNIRPTYSYPSIILASLGSIGCQLWGVNQYDIAGSISGVTQAGESTPNPSRIDCGLVFMNRF